MSERKTRKLGVIDPSSYSNPEKVKVTHLELFLDINFDDTNLIGKVHVKCEKLKNVATGHLVLDVKDLKIHKVTNLSNNKPLNFDIGESFGNFGSPLSITLPDKENDDDSYVICVEYETSSQASALQWLSPEQTLGKVEPFMFSQCQAEITAPKELIVLMSGIRDGDALPFKKNKLLWRFSQDIPIPSYLIAIVAGRLKGKILGPKSMVYSEPEIIKECAFEFSETDKMLKSASAICGRYVWGRYDLLVLPPSFPFGGMENPCLTFVTPTLLAGDRSLANVVAHEIAHSWTGNLVTNINFEHFWLNEGFTTYVERKIVGAMYGEPQRHFHAILGLKSLEETIIKNLGETNPLTCLVPKLKHLDPDDAFSEVPYEKGHTLLFYLETLLNEDGMFDSFLRSYLDKFKFQTVNTDDFKNYLYEFFTDQKDILDKVDWNSWLYCPGMPPVIPDYDRSLLNDIDNLIEKWRAWVPSDDCLFDSTPFKKSDFDTLISAQKCMFLAELLEKESLDINKLKLMHQVYHMEELQNAEVKFAWLRVCIKGRWKDRIPDALKFLNEQGRMKFVRPIYRDLYQWEYARKTATENYLQNRKYMMFVLSNQLERDLHLKKDLEN
ncbi:hypothetical protein RUM44_011815 [Polyplax serrata]|uniref:Peptidase M1 leukotriene A4 hydrolase/aminopeptidase C-terminal domain-containing protein n=1 Tax=Polyplax serrata TaxID=468196 RepID=A0ABR1AR40_POLSC